MPWAKHIWRKQLRPIEEQGYIIPAFNVDSDIDYVDAARTLAKTLLAHDPAARICLLTNKQYAADYALFAYTHVVDINTANPYANDALVFSQTPFRETIKLEADMLIATPIDHWWSMFRHRDVVVSVGCRTWQDQPSTARNYRQVFDDNNLPDVYNAITYWRLSPTAKEFFDTVRNIFANWDQYRTLIKFSPDRPDTDLVYAMAAQIVGPEKVTVPGSPTIVHMKKAHAGTAVNDWTQELVWEMNPLRINTVAQWGAFHYHVKRWHNELE
jgi:hypothetical protein